MTALPASIPEPLEAIATREGRLVVIRVEGVQIGAYGVTRWGRLVKFDTRTQEWMRPLAEEALVSGISRMAVMIVEEDNR